MVSGGGKTKRQMYVRDTIGPEEPDELDASPAWVR